MSSVQTTSTLADDKMEGASAIAAFLGWPAQKVYHARRAKSLPIRSLPGIGLFALKSELTAAFKAPETMP